MQNDLSNSALPRRPGGDPLAGFGIRFCSGALGPRIGRLCPACATELGKNLILGGSVRPNDGIVSPQGLGSATQMLAVYVEDPDAHFARARGGGANILYPLANTDFGSREYHVLDLEGRPWTFGTDHPAVEDCENR